MDKLRAGICLLWKGIRMSIADWTSERGLAAIEKMGWPEWEYDNKPCRLKLDEPSMMGRFWWTECGDTTFEISPREALALLRDHAREWLAERRDELSIHFCRLRFRDGDAGREFWAAGPADQDGMILGDPPDTADYDLALVAAIEAAPAPAEAPQDG